MATVVSYTTTLTLNGGSTVVFADDPANKGRYGTQARAQVLHHEAVHGTPTGENAVETIVPYDAILKAEFARGSAEVTKPEDTFCVSEDNGVNP